jgi:hypothetical protein
LSQPLLKRVRVDVHLKQTITSFHVQNRPKLNFKIKEPYHF